jgi:hypothetical protein
MKRNWLTYVPIVAALVAGTACSTALADGKGKFGGGSSRSMGGSARNSGGSSFKSHGGNSGFKSLNSNSSLNRNLTTRPLNGNGQDGYQLNSQNLNQGGLRKVQVSPGTQNRTLPGLSGVQLNKGVGGPNLVTGGLGKYAPKPEITINKNFQKTPLLQTNKSLTLNSDAIKKIGPLTGNQPTAVLNPNAISKVPLLPKPNPIYCGPISNPCYNPCNNWCGPCWWWSPWYNSPCYTGCYYPSIYTYPTPIVVEVPVATTVVATRAVVAPAAAVEPVAAEAADKLLQIPVGSTITLQGKDLGDKAGQVVVQVDKISLPAQMNAWKVDSAVATLPMIGLAGPTKAQLWMVKADGAVAANLAVELIPAQPPADATAAKGAL